MPIVWACTKLCLHVLNARSGQTRLVEKADHGQGHCSIDHACFVQAEGDLQRGLRKRQTSACGSAWKICMALLIICLAAETEADRSSLESRRCLVQGGHLALAWHGVCSRDAIAEVTHCEAAKSIKHLQRPAHREACPMARFTAVM